MGTIRIPYELETSAKAVGARKWVKKRRFPRNQYFAAIDDFRNGYKKISGGDEPSNQIIADMICATIAATGDLATHAKKESVAASSKEAWAEMCEAAGWCVLQAYLTAVEKGKWPLS